jgi:hypothetical protein
MTSLRASHDPTALDQYNKTINGHIYQPDEQCHHYRNGSSYFLITPLVSSDFSHILLSSEVDTVE